MCFYTVLCCIYKFYSKLFYVILWEAMWILLLLKSVKHINFVLINDN